jgi:hypothetical protein
MGGCKLPPYRKANASRRRAQLGKEGKWYDKGLEIKSYEIARSESDKTKRNWFIYELSNDVYNAASIFLSGLGPSRPVLPKRVLKKFSVDVAGETVRQIREQKGEGKKELIFSTSMFEQLLKGRVKPKLIRELVNITLDVIQETMENCLHCSTGCLVDLDGKCTMFDEGPY